MEGFIFDCPDFGPDYELIDSGGFEKLERFGQVLTARPEPQALWPKSDPGIWSTAQAVFSRDGRSEEKGTWTLKKGTPEQWNVEFRCGGRNIKMRLGLTSFKHVGLFPEQCSNWRYIFDRVSELKTVATAPKILNLFAYTGGASLAAAAGGAVVTHVDSVKQVVNWARGNAEMSGLGDIRWIVDDALKFARREVRRGNRYNGIILDPPAYGRGPDGEKWILEDNLPELLDLCGALVDDRGFIILNLYSMGFSPIIARTAVESIILPHLGNRNVSTEFGELYFRDSYSKDLPLGIFHRMCF